ncbi:hypothetical protein AB6E94_19435 [Vibrio lentus]|uniref:hypothetical protein n=1 Tax=Vibrio splendidus TaxID=29497 RepID=UPI000C81C865|nr:hypothetical protein [Vibrio splendidus]PMG17876.1 hypothetical protein BCU98_00655 [Vibrio splendidus]
MKITRSWASLSKVAKLASAQDIEQDIAHMNRMNHDRFIWGFTKSTTFIVPLGLGYPLTSFEALCSMDGECVLFEVNNANLSKVTRSYAVTLVVVPPAITVTSSSTESEAFQSISTLLRKSPAFDAVGDKVDRSNIHNVMMKLKRKGKIQLLNFCDDTLQTVGL